MIKKGKSLPARETFGETKIEKLYRATPRRGVLRGTMIKPAHVGFLGYKRRGLTKSAVAKARSIVIA